MGEIQEAKPVLLVAAVFSRESAALEFARERFVEQAGPIRLESPWFEFTETDYYEPTMGPGLRKGLWAFERLIDPAELPGWKRRTNAWEEEYATSPLPERPAEVVRPLNLDPGYLTLAKLVLATTKDRDHRLFLGGGIYGEVTLHFQAGSWRTHPWTYPDYARPEYHRFFDQCRAYLRQRLRG